ncbi:MAG: HAAS signaling domain-containing protein [Candidatus Dormibacteria bacterium]
MGQSKRDELTRDYLREVDRRLGSLPRSRRRQIREDLQVHIEEACRQLAPDDEAGVRPAPGAAG